MNNINLHTELTRLFEQAVEIKKGKLAYKIYCYIQCNKNKLKLLKMPTVRNIKEMSESEISDLSAFLSLPNS